MTRRLVRVLLAGLLLACSADAPDGAGRDAATAPPLTRLLPSDAVATIGAETRLALILKPPAVSRREFTLTLPANAVLHFGFGIPNSSLAEGASGARFAVELDDGEGTTPVLDARVDPSQPSHRRWFNVEADLSAHAGKTVILAFTVEAEGDAPPLGVFSDPVVSDAAFVDPRRNLVIVSLDTLRAPSVGSYGYGRETSPYLDSLAERGALFEGAITTSVTTGPSHMSLFTGLYPVNHGLSTGLEYKAEPVSTLARVLRAAGYQTTAFTENGYIVRARGFGDGFSEYTENKAILRKRGPGEVRVTFGQAQRWLEAPGRAREPFHLFIHTYEVHSPFRPPKEYAALFRDDDHPGPEDPALRRQRDNYDREIRYVDDKLRELVGTLEERGLMERTLLVITADHGEEFHEHGRYQHGGAVFDETLRVPLLFLGPDVPPGRHAGQVSLIDVLPTVIDYLDVEETAQRDGVSLLPVIRGETDVAPRTLFAEARGKKRWLR
ncbi:MAG: sulfatase, partial [Myxococcota bacterium]